MRSDLSKYAANNRINDLGLHGLRQIGIHVGELIRLNPISNGYRDRRGQAFAGLDVDSIFLFSRVDCAREDLVTDIEQLNGFNERPNHMNARI